MIRKILESIGSPPSYKDIARILQSEGWYRIHSREVDINVWESLWDHLDQEDYRVLVRYKLLLKRRSVVTWIALKEMGGRKSEFLPGMYDPEQHAVTLEGDEITEIAVRDLVRDPKKSGGDA